MTNAKQYIEALKFEREGYQRRGLEDRVAQVDEQIKIWEKRAAGESRADAAGEPDATEPEAEAEAEAEPEASEAPAEAEPEPEAEKVTTEESKPRSRR